ncbi:hypothetical protein PF672P2_00039 [Parabacteroides phage PF672P2]|nr:hypothetical protein PF672P2_00039 [Parabacteroides phage PF672P2]
MVIKVDKKINDVLYKVFNEKVQKYTIEAVNANYSSKELTVYYTCKDTKGDIKVIYEGDLCYYAETPHDAVVKHVENLAKKIEDDWNKENK